MCFSPVSAAAISSAISAVANGVFPVLAAASPVVSAASAVNTCPRTASDQRSVGRSAAASKALEMFMVRAAAQNPLPIIAVNQVWPPFTLSIIFELTRRPFLDPLDCVQGHSHEQLTQTLMECLLISVKTHLFSLACVP